MSLTNISGNDKVKIRTFLDEGVDILQRIEDLKEGLKEATKALAEELDIKPTVLTKALNASFKNNLADAREIIDDVEIILHAGGRL